MVECYWQNWDKGEIAKEVDSYWASSTPEARWRKLLEFGEKAYVLKVGCGSGLIYQETVKQRVVTAKSYVGGDISLKMPRITQQFPKAKFINFDIPGSRMP